MNSETKSCQNCNNDFIIEPEDFAFYEKIDVPPPTFCPWCRFIRRYSHRNQSNLYKRNCDLCNTSIITMFKPETTFPVYCQKCWWSDNWNPTEYAMKYNFERPFFEQFAELENKIPHIALTNINPVNSDYVNFGLHNKNCYLSYSIGHSEDCSYCGPQVVSNRQSISVAFSVDNEQCYECVDCVKNTQLFFSQEAKNCLDSWFLYNCRNCQHCLGCVNLRNKTHCIFNEQYSREEYEQKLNEFKLHIHQGLQNFKKKFQEFKLSQPHRHAFLENTHDCTGNHIYDSKNCHQCFTMHGGEDSKYCFISNGGKNLYDVSNTYPDVELQYETMSGVESSQAYFIFNSMGENLDIWYSSYTASSTHVFGCCNAKNMKYAILNKEYTKEEYEELIPKIKQHMIDMPYQGNNGREYKFGEFFPVELSVFGYNETVAQEYEPLTAQEIHDKGYLYYEKENTQHTPTINVENIPNDINNVDETITKEIIECEHKSSCTHNCVGAFRITAQEFMFYQKFKIPLPTICPNCRGAERIERRLQLKLFKRTSDDGVDVMTPYSPDRPEKILSEEAYKREVL